MLAMKGHECLSVAVCAVTVLLLDSPPIFGAPAEVKQKSVVVSHPNLLLNQDEIAQIKLKVREYPWAARLLELVKAKAQKDNSLIENALAYSLTGEATYATNVRDQLVREAREQMPHYDKLDVKAEPEWARWNWWGATAWGYDLAYDVLSSDERVEIERWLRTAGHTIIAQENVLTTTPNLAFDEHWRVGLIGYCLGDHELIDWAVNDPGRHGPSRGGFYSVMDTMIRDEQF